AGGMAVGDINIPEGNRPAGREIACRIDVGVLDDSARCGRLIDDDGRLVVGTGDGDGEGLEVLQGIRRVVRIDLGLVGQDYRLAFGEKVEVLVGYAVGGERRTDVLAAGILRH